MSGVWIGVDGVARKIIGVWIGVDGVARKVTNGYIGINGVARQFYKSMYTCKFQCNTVSSSYGVVNSYSNKYVTDHWELFMNSTITKSSSSYATYNEIKVSSNSEALSGKNVTITYSIDTYDSSGITGIIACMDSSNTNIKYTYLTSTKKTTTTFAIASNTSWIVISNHIWKIGTHSNTLNIYSLKVGDEVLI